MHYIVTLKPDIVGDPKEFLPRLLNKRYTRNVERGKILFGDGRIELITHALSEEESGKIQGIWGKTRSTIEIVRRPLDPRSVRFVGGLLRGEEFSFYIPNIFIRDQNFTLKVSLAPSPSEIMSVSPERLQEMTRKLEDAERKLEETRRRIRDQESGIATFLSDARKSIRRDTDMAGIRNTYKTEESLGKINRASGKLTDALKNFRSALSGRRKFEKIFGKERTDSGHLQAIEWIKREIASVEKEISKRETFRPPTPVRSKRPSLDLSGGRTPSPVPRKRSSLGVSGIRSPSPIPTGTFFPITPDLEVKISDQLRSIREDCGF